MSARIDISLLGKFVERFEQATFFCLAPRAGVAGDDAAQTLATESPQELRAVERMAARANKRGRVTDIVHVRGGHQHLELGRREDERERSRSLDDS